MPRIHARRLVSVPADIAYAVAADVPGYCTFLPLLEQSRIVGPIHEEGGARQFRAELVVGYSKLKIQEKFTSAVTCDHSRRIVTATSQEAPFRNVKTIWTVIDNDGQSDVSIDIDYAMRNPLLQIALGGAMDIAIKKVMSAFEEQARSVYATASKSS